jgi:hypothetical protein
MTDLIVNPMLDELRGYAKLLAFDCNNEEVKGSTRFKQICEKEDHVPFFQLIKPAEIKVNPYTNKPMTPQSISYPENQVSPQKVKSYVLSNLPDYSVNINSLKKLDEFLDSTGDKDINRVILFSKKAKTPPVYKVLTAWFRDRFRFGFVPAETSQEVVAKFEGVNEFPSILVLKGFDVEANTTLESVETIRYSNKEYKIDELKEFLNPLATNGKKDSPRQASKSENEEGSSERAEKKTKKTFVELYNDRHFNTHIADNEKAALVFFTSGANVTEAFPLFDKILKATHGPLQVGVFYVNETAEDIKENRKKYKLGNKLPQLRFYRNNLLGEEKNQKSFELTETSSLEAVLDEVHDSIDSDVKEMTEKIIMNVATSVVVEEKKNVVFYFYETDRVSLHVKALSALPILRDSFVFMSLTNPSQQFAEQFQISKMPTIAGILPPPPDQPENIR